MSDTHKILVCITPQSNSIRLIDRAYAEAESINGQLHILHVKKGDSLFDTEESSLLLQTLFDYGSERKGVIHGVCGEDVSQVIIDFIIKEAITIVVFGAPLANAPVNMCGMFNYIKEAMPQVRVMVVERAEGSTA